MIQHREILEEMAKLHEAARDDLSSCAYDEKESGNLSAASSWQKKANEAQERADAIRHALEVMRKAETLPKTADGVTVWPNDRLHGYNESGPFEHETPDFLVPWSGRLYSTPQAARDAAEGKK
jgi:type II secretory pathway pseudopilin PulG